jgi:hypothetical protein
MDGWDGMGWMDGEKVGKRERDGFWESKYTQTSRINK